MFFYRQFSGKRYLFQKLKKDKAITFLQHFVLFQISVPFFYVSTKLYASMKFFSMVAHSAREALSWGASTFPLPFIMP